MSNLSSVLQTITQQELLILPKEVETAEKVTAVFREFLETEDSWLVPCKHILHPPATWEDVTLVERSLGQPLPEELRRLLFITNGANLYVAPLAWKPTWAPDSVYVRYHLFSDTELIAVNRTLLGDFLSLLGDDPDFRGYHSLNYIAFCDAREGNYLAILLEGLERGKVFFLNHEYLFRPYSEQDADLYHTVAKSLESWLELVAKTNGFGGFGKDAPIS